MRSSIHGSRHCSLQDPLVLTIFVIWNFIARSPTLVECKWLRDDDDDVPCRHCPIVKILPTYRVDLRFWRHRLFLPQVCTSYNMHPPRLSSLKKNQTSMVWKEDSWKGQEQRLPKWHPGLWTFIGKKLGEDSGRWVISTICEVMTHILLSSTTIHQHLYSTSL